MQTMIDNCFLTTDNNYWVLVQSSTSEEIICNSLKTIIDRIAKFED